MRFNRISVLALLGFLLSCAVAFIIHYAPQLHIEGFSLFNANTVTPLLPIIRAALILQGVSIILLWAGFPGAILLAYAGGLVMIPVGLIFIEGCLVTHQRGRYKWLNADLPGPDDYGLTYSNTSPENNPHVGLGVVLTGVLFYMLGVTSAIGTFLVVIGIILAARGKRLQSRPVLGLYDDFFVVTPNIWADAYSIPYGSVRAYQLKNKKVNLLVEDAKGKEHELVIPLRRIHPEDREDASTTFASRLALGTHLFNQYETHA